MPTLTMEAPPAAKTLFIGLQSYSEAQANIFYGRDDEIDRLTNLVKANTLTIVFGKSGTGKTSLLNAGVFPRLRKDYCLPFRIRLEFGDNSPDLVTQIKNVLKKEIDTYGFTVESYPGAETLWEYFHKEQLWKSITPILIFDQFEEIFTLAKKNERFSASQLTGFWQELSNLVENTIPDSLKEKFLNHKEQVSFNYKKQKIKILFAFREEYLPEFENITSKIPSIKISRFRLMPMNGNQAYEVITKTWKNNIDAAEAHKVVGFFVKEEDKDKSYEVMEIEPSLLSQVCSFIDKERSTTTGQKISADFLNRYPKEMILRSIYDEALDESNRAVSHAGLLQEGKRPVNEFVEDKLITDEGYRTKYAVKHEEEGLRPGIEVLKGKYFVRDDGSSIELTHDVLVPIIKSDREERRKALAVAAARKKANRRAFVIIIFSVLAAIAIWWWITRKAFNEKAAAEKKTAQLQYQLKKDSVKLAAVQDSIKKARVKPGDKTVGANGNISITDISLSADSAYRANDSTELANLQRNLNATNRTKAELEKNLGTLKGEMGDYATNLARSDANNKAARATIAALRRQITEDSNLIVLLQKQLVDLQKKYNAYEFSHPESIYIAKKRTEPDPADNNSLKLNLFYNAAGKEGKVPDNLKVYMIPDNKANRSIIHKAQVYEIDCDQNNLDAAKGNKIARWKDGLYTFYDVAPGPYFIKICGYYGGFYSYRKRAIGNDTLRRDASPPIR